MVVGIEGAPMHKCGSLDLQASSLVAGLCSKGNDDRHSTKFGVMRVSNNGDGGLCACRGGAAGDDVAAVPDL